jgi:thiol-disulfide isomerase/thioredoxin
MRIAGCAGALARAVLISFISAAGFCLAAQPVKKIVATDATIPPALALKDTSGKLHRLADYRGKVVLVNFWASWCEPCRDELRSMQRLYRRLGPRHGGDLVILAVNHAENADRVERFLRLQSLGFPVLLDSFGTAWAAWKPGFLPASFLIGRDEKLRYRALGAIDWAGREAEATLRALLRERG